MSTLDLCSSQFYFSGCEGRGTAETNYQCPICLKQQQRQERFCQTEGNSKFYVEGVDLSSDEPDCNDLDLGTSNSGKQGRQIPEIIAENLNMTVKLPASAAANLDPEAAAAEASVDTVDSKVGEIR